MPIPKPNPNQTQTDFMQMCMGDKMMNKDYTDQKQRLAVCQSQWDKSQKSKDSFLPDIERRSFRVADLRVAVDPAGKEPPKLQGYAAVFNQLSEDLGGFREQIAPGAFKNTLANDDIRALFNHDPNMVLGRNKAGTLRAREDQNGVAFEVDVPDTQCGRDLLVSVKRGDISQCSFAFTTNSDTWNNGADGTVTRTLNDVTCMDLSPVTYPAYPQTSVKARSYIESLKESQGKQGVPPKEGRAASLETVKRQIGIAEVS